MPIGQLIQGFMDGQQRKQDREYKINTAKIESDLAKSKLKSMELEQQMIEHQANLLKQQVNFGEKNPDIAGAPKELSGIMAIQQLFNGNANNPTISSSAKDPLQIVQDAESKYLIGNKGKQTEQPSSITNDLAQMLYGAQFQKILGVNPYEGEYRTTVGTEGQPGQGFFYKNMQQGQVKPGSFSPYAQDYEKIQKWNPQTNQMEWMSVSKSKPLPEGIISKPPEIDIQQTQKGGVIYETPVDRYTRQPVGQPTVREELKPLQGEAAGRLQLAQNGLNEMDSIVNMFINPDGTINKTNIINSWVGTPKTKGRDAKQAFGRAIDAVIRAATGAALTGVEIKSYTNLYYPSPFDTENGIKNKLQSLENFLNGYLTNLDPNGNILQKNQFTNKLTSNQNDLNKYWK